MQTGPAPPLHQRADIRDIASKTNALTNAWESAGERSSAVHPAKARWIRFGANHHRVPFQAPIRILKGCWVQLARAIRGIARA